MATGVGVTDRLEALVLAAGTGSRFGGGKLLAPWGQGLLLHGALAAAFAAPARGVTVVTGADAAAVGAAARAYNPAVRVVHAADFAEGMGASLRAGIAGLPKDTAGAFVFLGDMPRVPHEVLGSLAEALGQGATAAAPTFQGRRGNPVLLSAALFPQLLALTGDQGARSVVQGLGAQLALIEVLDDGVLFDVDERGDLG
ncbi:MAG TPA: nucleotidyltransferase family protein [Phenylobacterium sp.]|nr:nucleotidyltransferase family protein [Phenylobacterium sp.]